MREGGLGLPPNPIYVHQVENDCTVFLFTCCSCGKRLVNPPGPPSDMVCSCGGEFVCHTFDPEEYTRIRWYGDPRARWEGSE
jgi:hypothetical protein